MIQIKHILCPVDLSPFSRHAFDRAVAVARCYDAKISVLHVLPVHTAIPAIPFGPEGPSAFWVPSAAREHVLAAISQFLEVEHWTGTPVEYHVVDAPSVPSEIVVQTARLVPDLVVMGTHGRSGFDRVMLGRSPRRSFEPRACR